MNIVVTDIVGFIQTVELAIDFGIPLPNSYYDKYYELIEERNNQNE